MTIIRVRSRQELGDRRRIGRCSDLEAEGILSGQRPRRGSGIPPPHGGRGEFSGEKKILQFRAFRVVITIYTAVADSVKRFNK